MSATTQSRTCVNSEHIFIRTHKSCHSQRELWIFIYVYRTTKIPVMSITTFSLKKIQACIICGWMEDSLIRIPKPNLSGSQGSIKLVKRNGGYKSIQQGSRYYLTFTCRSQVPDNMIIDGKGRVTDVTVLYPS